MGNRKVDKSRLEKAANLGKVEKENSGVEVEEAPVERACVSLEGRSSSQARVGK